MTKRKPGRLYLDQVQHSNDEKWLHKESMRIIFHLALVGASIVAAFWTWGLWAILLGAIVYWLGLGDGVRGGEWLLADDLAKFMKALKQKQGGDKP